MGDFSLVNALTLAVGLLFLSNGYRLVRDSREDITVFVISVVVGSGLLVVSVFPGLFEVVARFLGLDWKARAILVVSNLTLFLLVVYQFRHIAQLQDKTSKLNEELSLLRVAVEEESERPGDGDERDW